MDKRIIVLVICLIGAALAWGVYQKTASPKAKYRKSTISQNYPHKCLSCGETFDLSTDEMERMVHKGKVKSPPGEYRRFECPTCGEIEAVFRDSKYEDLGMEP